MSRQSWQDRYDWWRAMLERLPEPHDCDTCRSTEAAEQRAHDEWWEAGWDQFFRAVNYRLDIADVDKSWMTHDTEACLRCVERRRRLYSRRNTKRKDSA